MAELTSGGKIAGYGIAVRGFAGLNAALARIDGEGRADFGLEYEVRRRLAEIGEGVAKAAPSFVTHHTGRHGTAAERLEDSVEVSVTRRFASVYSTADHGGVQNVGGMVGNRRGPHVTRARASRYMIRAVDSNRAYIEARIEGVVEWLLAEFHAPPL